LKNKCALNEHAAKGPGVFPGPFAFPAEGPHRIIPIAVALSGSFERLEKFSDFALMVYFVLEGLLLFFLDEKKKQKKSRLAPTLRGPSLAHAQGAYPKLAPHSVRCFEQFGVLLPNAKGAGI
jgi:hypothetical protein